MNDEYFLSNQVYIGRTQSFCTVFHISFWLKYMHFAAEGLSWLPQAAFEPWITRVNSPVANSLPLVIWPIVCSYARIYLPKAVLRWPTILLNFLQDPNPGIPTSDSCNQT